MDVIDVRTTLTSDAGGFKVWECSLDLARHMHTFVRDELIRDGTYESVAELGCGHALPTLALCALLDRPLKRVLLQDYNKSVLEQTTMYNWMLSGAHCAETESLFAHGDWSLLQRTDEPFDIILTSETLYNEQSVAKLLDCVERLLAPRGVCLLSSKRYYFGVGGGTMALMAEIGRREKEASTPPYLCAERVRVYDDGKSNVREIFAVRWKEEIRKEG